MIPPHTAHIQILQACKKLFQQKNKDYDTAWRIMRLSSCTDQLFIKAQRIRTIQEQKKQKVADTINTELMGIINYGIIALLQLGLGNSPRLHIPFQELSPLYDGCVQELQELLARKNHDYGEAWRSMRETSLIDIILMKILRLKSIEDNAGKTRVSEGILPNYQDIVNYAVLTLIQRGFVPS